MKENNNINMTELKKLVKIRADELKAIYLAKKVKKEFWSEDFFKESANLISGVISIEKYCEKYNIDKKHIKKAEREGAKAVEMLLE